MRWFTLILMLTPIVGLCQNPTLTAAWRIGGAGYEQGFEVSIDQPGHAVVAGYFESTVDFDPGAGTQSRTSAGLHDIFVAKYTSTGAYEWAIRIGGTGYDQATGVDVDASGNVYVSGYFAGTVDFNPGAGTNNLSASADDAFVAKYDPNGNYLWAIKIGGSGYDMSNNCTTDGSGNVFVTGHFVNTVDFDPSPGTANLASAGSMDMYLAKYSPTGTYLWAIRVGSSGLNDDSGYDLATFGTDVYVTGLWSGTVDFDPGVGTVTRTGAGGNDIFLLKLNGSGAFQWVYTGATSDTDESCGVDVDALGNVYVAGGFSQTIDFDPGAGVSNLASMGVLDVFVAKYTSAGALVWARQIGGVGNQHCWGMAVSPDGNSYFTGYLGSSADFDPGTGSFLLTSAGNFDSYLGSLDANGNFRFAFGLGASNMDVGYGVDANDACEVGITGYFEGTTDFDPLASTLNLSSVGGFDAYVAVYGACGVLGTQRITLAAEIVPSGVLLNWAHDSKGEVWQYRAERSEEYGDWLLVGEEAWQSSCQRLDGAPILEGAWYRVLGKDIDGRRIESTAVWVNGICVPWRLGPNPSTGGLLVQVPNGTKDLRMELWDANGRLQWTGGVDEGITKLDFGDLPKGMYVLHWQENGPKTMRWVLH